jgi:hypothetical protein
LCFYEELYDARKTIFYDLIMMKLNSARRSYKQQRTSRNCEAKIKNCPHFTMARPKKTRNCAQHIVNTRHQKTMMKLHGTNGVHKENGSCKSEIMLTKRRKKLKNKINCKKLKHYYKCTRDQEIVKASRL